MAGDGAPPPGGAPTRSRRWWNEVRRNPRRAKRARRELRGAGRAERIRQQGVRLWHRRVFPGALLPRDPWGRRRPLLMPSCTQARVREPWRHSGATWAGTRYRADRESGYIRSGCEASCVLHNRSREIRSPVRCPSRHLLGKPFASYVDFLSCHPTDPKRVPGRRRRPS